MCFIPQSRIGRCCVRHFLPSIFGSEVPRGLRVVSHPDQRTTLAQATSTHHTCAKRDSNPTFYNNFRYCRCCTTKVLPSDGHLYQVPKPGVTVSCYLSSRSFVKVKTTPQLWNRAFGRNSFLQVACLRPRRPPVVFSGVNLSPSSCRASSFQPAACITPQSLHPPVAPDTPHDVGGQHGVAGSVEPA